MINELLIVLLVILALEVLILGVVVSIYRRAAKKTGTAFGAPAGKPNVSRETDQLLPVSCGICHVLFYVENPRSGIGTCPDCIKKHGTKDLQYPNEWPEGMANTAENTKSHFGNNRIIIERPSDHDLPVLSGEDCSCGAELYRYDGTLSCASCGYTRRSP